MSKSIESMYEALINQSDTIDTLGGPHRTNYVDEEDSEEFMTSKELIKTKEHLEEKYGVIQKGDGVIEEEVHFKRYTKRREHKYTEKEMQEIKESCVATIVHDYSENDTYHISDEERAANDMLSELGIKLDGLKRTYRKVDQYIEAMRIVVQAWEMLEEKGNFIHTREEFFQMVSEGKIVSNRIIMPKLKKMDSYNIDMIIKYISNPELDPSDLSPVVPDDDDWYNDLTGEGETEEEQMLRLLSPEEFQFLKEHEDNPPKIRVKNISPKLIKGYDRRDFGRSKKGKKCSKKERYVIESLHDILNKIQSSEISRNRDYTRSSLITNSMFDIDKPEKDIWDNLYFDGSWANDNDVYLYDLAVREELLKQHPRDRQYLTFGDMELQNFFKILEDNGINTIDLRRKLNCTAESAQKEEIKHVKKENKKIESALLQKISKMNQSPKFKKLVSKAEDALNKQMSQY